MAFKKFSVDHSPQTGITRVGCDNCGRCLVCKQDRIGEPEKVFKFVEVHETKCWNGKKLR